MNIARGGTVLQDIEKTIPQALLHHPQVEPDELAHHISIEKESLLYRLFGSEALLVNSFHHQAVDKVAYDFKVTARSSDGVIEALEPVAPDRFALAVQFHPEGLYMRYPKFLAPFSALVQAAANSPIASAIKSGSLTMIPFANFTTVAEALSSGKPPGGDEIIAKAYQYGWLAEDATEEEIIEAQKRLAGAGFFVEPASATTLAALKKLRASGTIDAKSCVVAVLTGSGLKDTSVLSRHKLDIVDTDMHGIEKYIQLKDLEVNNR